MKKRRSHVQSVLAERNGIINVLWLQFIGRKSNSISCFIQIKSMNAHISWHKHVKATRFSVCAAASHSDKCWRFMKIIPSEGQARNTVRECERRVTVIAAEKWLCTRAQSVYSVGNLTCAKSFIMSPLAHTLTSLEMERRQQVCHKATQETIFAHYI